MNRRTSVYAGSFLFNDSVYLTWLVLTKLALMTREGLLRWHHSLLLLLSEGVGGDIVASIERSGHGLAASEDQRRRSRRRRFLVELITTATDLDCFLFW